MLPPNGPQRRGLLRQRQGGEQQAAAAFFHTRRLREHLHSTGSAQLLLQKRQSLGIHVVDLALLHHHRLTLGGLINSRRCRQTQPQQVGAIQLPLTQTHAHTIWDVGRRRIPVIHPHRQQGQTRGRC